jgi:FlaA1/EpsC-like NDP-sugar epimerase
MTEKQNFSEPTPTRNSFPSNQEARNPKEKPLQKSIPWQCKGHRLFTRMLRWAWKSGHPDCIKVVIDCILIIISAAWVWFMAYSQVPHPGRPWAFIMVVLVARLLIYFPLGLHRQSWLNVSRYEVFIIALSAILGVFVIAALFFILPQPFTLRALLRPKLMLATEPAFYLLLLCMVRFAARALASSPSETQGKRRILIVGAYDAGRSLAFQIQESSSFDYQVVGFVDNDSRLWGRRVRGVPVLGAMDDTARWAEYCEAQEIVIANYTLTTAELRRLLEVGAAAGLPVHILPRLNELMGVSSSLTAWRDVRMEDLLPRSEVKVDPHALGYLKGQTIIVTGGGGSIGGELCHQVITAGAARLIVLGHGENSVFEKTQELLELNSVCEIIPAICDVGDRLALQRIFQQYHPDAVFHAAAHKHVPLMEQYPCEAVKNNVLGTLNIVQLSIQERVKHFVMVSTDKAVDPSSVMGASKRIGEMIVKGHAKQSDANMVCVRFGNVLGSRGSVVPTMMRQIRQGLPVTITDEKMVRYFMTIPEAVQLILNAGAIGGTGDIFVLDMGQPVRILDLAYDLIRLSGLVPNQDVPIRVIGRRPGEKMFEDLLTPKEMSSFKRKGPFFIANVQEINMPEFLQSIEKLLVTARQGDSDSMIKQLQKLIPEFRANSGENPRRHPGLTAKQSPEEESVPLVDIHISSKAV